MARRGEHRKALALLKQEPTAVSNGVPDLLLAADVMRSCGHFEQAASYLDQIVKQHSRDSRSKLAAFTLGRVYLDELGRPREAAKMFKRAGSGKSPLAEEALAISDMEAHGDVVKCPKCGGVNLRLLEKLRRGSTAMVS